MKFMKKIMAAVAASAVAVLSFASLTASADLKAQDKAPYNAFLAFQAGGDKKWVSSTDDPAVIADKNNITEATEATITGDGSYSVDITMVNGSETIEAMILSTNINAFSFAPEGASTPTGGLPEGCTAKVEIDSIEVQHVGGGSTPLAYAGPSEGALRTADDGTSIRVNIMNVWTQPKVNDIGTGDHVSPDGGLAAGDKVVVNFTVSGISNGGNGEGTTAPSDTAAITLLLPLPLQTAVTAQTVLPQQQQTLTVLRQQLPQQVATAVLPTAAMVVLPTAVLVVLPVPTTPRAVPTMQPLLRLVTLALPQSHWVQ